MKINLVEYLQETLLEHDSRTAVIDGNRTIGYRELDSKARSVAGTIVREIGCKNCPIALLLPKSIESVYSDIAITYSGNAYMNLDVKNPKERLNNILSLIQPKAVITDTAHESIISDILPYGTRLINIDNIHNESIPDASFFMNHLSGMIDTDP